MVFVNGCFWHYHRDCPHVRVPSSNRDYWLPKLERNRDRDERNLARIERDGWTAMTVWECELRDIEAVEARLTAFWEREDRKERRALCPCHPTIGVGSGDCGVAGVVFTPIPRLRGDRL